MDTPAVDLTKYIETRFFGERPHVRGRRITVAQLAYSMRSQNWMPQELAFQFGLTEAQVLAALLYYEEHKAEIDAQEAKVRAELDELYEKYGKG
jgi:uncharacterized protein (DUF433 family)